MDGPGRDQNTEIVPKFLMTKGQLAKVLLNTEVIDTVT